MQNEVLDACRNLLKQGNIAASLDALANYCKESDSPHHDAALLLSAQWRQYQTERSLGLSDNTTTPNRIAQAALGIIRELEASTAAKHPGKRWFAENRRVFPWIMAGLVLVFVVWAIRQKDSGDTTHGNQSPILKESPGSIIEFHNKLDTNAVQRGQ